MGQNSEYFTSCDRDCTWDWKLRELTDIERELECMKE
jgi:hypothetical protein